MSPPLDRRRFLGLVGAAVGVAVVPLPGCAGDDDGAGPAPTTPTTPAGSPLRRSLAVLAAAVRAAAPELEPLDLEQVALGGSDDVLAAAVVELAPAMRDDFARGAVVDAGGWRLSETEARLALAAS